MKKLLYRIRIWKEISPHFQGIKGWYAGEMLSEAIIRITAMLFPIMYGVFLEKVILGKNMNDLAVVISGYLILQLLRSCMVVFRKACQNRVNYTVAGRMRIFALDKYFHMKFDTYRKINTGDIKMTLEDSMDKIMLLPTQFYQYCMNGIFVAIMAIVLIEINWRLAIIAFLAIPITFILDHLVSRSEKGVNEILNENDASWATWLDETMKGWKEIRVNQCENKRKAEFEQFRVIDETNFVIWLRYWVTRVLAIPKIKDDFIMQFLLYFLGGILIYYKYTSIGMLLVFVQYYGMLSEGVKEMSTADANLQSDMPHYDRILRHLNDEENMEADGDVLPEQYDVTFEGVTFGYADTDKNVVENLSFRIKAGDRVGFFGESGAGKSTVLKLMLGQLHPDAGNITYGTVALKEICKKKLYERIAYISQEAKLFNMSVLENLCLGNAGVSMEEIEAACKSACIYDFIMSLSDGFHTKIGENGEMLSGGQRQRLLLAKALLRDADLYIFDEATSALDGQVEEEIIDALECIPKDKTVMIVAHKERLMVMCDYVVRMG